MTADPLNLAAQLTEDERRDLRRMARTEHERFRVGQIIDRIKADAYAAGLAERATAAEERLERSEAALQRVLHDVWLLVHNRRFDEGSPDSIYNGILKAEQAIGDVAALHGIDYHRLRAALDPAPASEVRDDEGGA